MTCLPCDVGCQGLPWPKILDDHQLFLCGRRDCPLRPLLGRCEVPGPEPCAEGQGRATAGD